MKIPVWSYSFLNTYMNCPAQANARYIEKILPYEESEAAAYGNRVHKSFELAIKKNIPLDSDLSEYEQYLKIIKAFPTVHAEMSLGVTRDWKPSNFFGAQVYGRGKADVVVIQDRTGFLIDLKTGRSDYENSFELEIQALLLQAAHPELTSIKGCYLWLKTHQWGKVYDLSSKIEKTKETIEEIMRKVEQGLFYANKNPLCSWCALTSCKHWKDRSK